MARPVPILDEVGAGLHSAWRRAEGRRRRRARMVAAVAAVTLLAVPGAIAERSMTGLTPKQDARSPNDPRRKVPGAIRVADGASPAGHWQMFSYGKGSRRCVGLSLPGKDQASDYASSCEPRRGSNGSVALRGTDSALLVFGVLPEEAQSVDVQVLGGPSRTTPALHADPGGARLQGAQHHVRYYVAALPPLGDGLSPPTVKVRDAAGDIIARLSAPRLVQR